MSEQGPGGQPSYHAPAPFVTHEQMGGVHRQIGALEQGQASIMSTYNHLRGDMINGFDKMDKSITTLVATLDAQRQNDAKRAAQVPEPQGIQLSAREAFIACVAIMAATAFLTNMFTGGARPNVASAISQAMPQ